MINVIFDIYFQISIKVILTTFMYYRSLLDHTCIYTSGMPLGLFKKVGKYPGTGGLGSWGPGAAPWWGFKGRSPLEARAFSQSELPRKPPIDTHGRYTYNTCTGGKKEKEKKKKVGRSEKVRIPKKVGKTASLIHVYMYIV